MKRRTFLALPLAAAGLTSGRGVNASELPEIMAYRDPGCSCCEAWAGHMQAVGFRVSIADDPDRRQRTRGLGIPDELTSCHTAIAGRYFVEGHVLAADLIRLLEQAPAGAKGLIVAGMPVGSPGMGPEGSGDAYDVLLLTEGGQIGIFARH